MIEPHLTILLKNYLIEHLNKYIFNQFTENIKEFIRIDKNLERNFSKLITKSRQYASQNDLFNELSEVIESSLEFNGSLTKPVRDNLLQYNSVTAMLKRES